MSCLTGRMRAAGATLDSVVSEEVRRCSMQRIFNIVKRSGGPSVVFAWAVTVKPVDVFLENIFGVLLRRC